MAPHGTEPLTERMAVASIELASVELAFGRDAVAGRWLEGLGAAVPERWRARWLLESVAADADIDRPRAVCAGRALEKMAAVATDPWMAGAVTRSRGLLVGDAEAARGWFEASAWAFGSGDLGFEAGRSLLLAGLAAGRASRPDAGAARSLLARALDHFVTSGAVAWELAALAALGRTPAIQGARVGPVPCSALSPAERRVAELAALGSTNREIAGALYLSTRTVDAHLRAIYRKLGLRSRVELAGLFARR